MAKDGRGRGLRWLMLVVPLLLVGGIIAASFLQHLAPPGTQIMNKTVPEEHPSGPCYNCHEGMATGQAIEGKDAPADHPAKDCARCHEGYQDGPASGSDP